jgi:outer membrane lipoprotein SlyB
MTSAVIGEGVSSKGAPRYLWAAVGVLGVATLALGATLVQMKSHPMETEMTQSAPASQVVVAPVAAVPVAPVTPIQPQKVAKAPVKYAQTATKTVAKTSVIPRETTRPAPGVEDSADWSAAPPVVAQAPKVVCANCGTVASVTPVQRDAKTSGLGVIAGGLLGGMVGNQVGGGTGKTIATVLGMVGGGWAGNTVEQRMKKETVYQVEVRMEDGTLRTFEQASPAAVGARVTVDGNVISPAG